MRAPYFLTLALTYSQRSYPRLTNETKMEQIAHVKLLIFSKTKADLAYRPRRKYSDAQKSKFFSNHLTQLSVSKNYIV